MLFPRHSLEQREQQSLAPYAAFASQSRGRSHPEQESAYRTAYQKDRDRVIHTSAFRRLEYKTQVFVNFQGDYYRTRLTHTLEVAQVAKSVARALGLNEDLTETIALAHDLGHPPFGHAGERALDMLAKEAGEPTGFDHNRQSLRVVTELERRYPNFDGLNLTWETLEGIMKHELDPEVFTDVLGASWQPDWQPTLEAQLVDMADEITYGAHDLDDGLTSGFLSPAQVCQLDFMAQIVQESGLQPQQLVRSPHRAILIREWLGIMIQGAIAGTEAQLQALKPQSLQEVRDCGKRLVTLTPALQAQQKQLKNFLYENFYFHHKQMRMAHKAEYLLERMFHAYYHYPSMLSKDVLEQAERHSLARAITDYLAGMTDRYAAQEYKRLFDPESLT